MDQISIAENQKSVYKVTAGFKRALALLLAFCLLFLTSCSERTSTASQSQGVSESHTTSVEERTEIPSTTAKTSDEQTSAEETKQETTKSEETTSEKSKEKKQTAAATTAKKEVNTTKQSSGKYCYLSIDCSTVLQEDNYKKLDSSKKGVIPSDGVILKKTKTEFFENENVYDVFRRFCQNNVCSHACSYCQGRIQFETKPSIYGTYIRGIHYLYEKDCGTKSGWMYKVNGVFPEYAVDYCPVSENDVIEFIYTCTYDDV